MSSPQGSRNLLAVIILACIGVGLAALAFALLLDAFSAGGASLP